MYVSMQYKWEETERRKVQKHFNCHHYAASLPIQKPDASVLDPLVWGSSRGMLMGTHTYMYHFSIFMNYILVLFFFL